MFRLVRENWIALLLAILVGILVVFPSFYFRYFDGAYRGIDLFGSGNEDFYLTQIQEIYDGHWSFGNIYLADGKDDYYVPPPLPAMLTAFLGKSLGISARDINLLTKFLFPALLTIIVYALFLNLTRRKDVAILMAAFVILVQATWVLLNPAAWWPLLTKSQFLGTNLNFISYARPINPQLSSILFFGYLLTIWKFLFEEDVSKSKKIYGIVSAIILGLSFYTYFYAYSFLAAFNGVLAIWFLYSRDWDRFKKMLLVSLGALAVGIPYFINFFGVMRSPFYGRLSVSLGVFKTHRFIFSRVWLGVSVIFLLLYRKLDHFKVFIAAFLTAGFIVTNQQLITGKIAPMVAHYHWYYIAPMSGAILIYLFFLYFEKAASRPIFRSAMILSLLFFLYVGILYQKESYAASREWFVSLQRYAPTISWLDKNIKKESTIFANIDLSNWIPGYTSHNIYLGGIIQDSLICEDRLRHVFYTSSFLNGVSGNSSKKFFYENKELVGAAIFEQYYREKNGCYGCFPDFILDQLISEYQDFLEKDFTEQLKKYPIDYAVWDKEKNPEWQLDRFFKDKIYESDNLLIYKIL